MADWEISTERLTIRPMRVEDAVHWHRIRASAPFDPVNRSVEESIALITAMQLRASPDSDGWQQFAVLAHDGRYAGDLGVRFSPPWNASCEIGFAIDPMLRGNGYASEAAGAMIERLFRANRRRVVAVTDARNRPAQRVLERNWFRLEGRFVESWREGDQWYDELTYARLARE